MSLIRKYRTQRTSWLGLAPGAFLKLVLQRREFVREAKASNCCLRPHEGSLFYERRFGDRYESFEALAQPFIKRRINVEPGVAED
jgi:hypothetical protein